MSVLVVWSAQPRAGKTTVAAGLAQKLAFAGIRSGLLRAHDDNDEEAAEDARFFTSIPFTERGPDRAVSLTEVAGLAARIERSGVIAIVETSAGVSLDGLASLSPQVVRVARYGSDWEQAAPNIEQKLAGLVLTAVPGHRRDDVALEVQQLGLRTLALLPEDRLLSSPTIAEIALALAAEIRVPGHNLDIPMENLVVAPISADQGYAHFSRWERKAVIGRYDKPDLLLAALNAETDCLVVTGGWPPLEYVTDRAANEGIPLLLVKTDTVTTLQKLEDLYERTRFHGSAKLQRISELMDKYLDFVAVAAALGVKEVAVSEQ